MNQILYFDKVFYKMPNETLGKVRSAELFLGEVVMTK